MAKLLFALIGILVVESSYGMDLSAEDKQKLMDMHNACVAETGVSGDLVTEAMAGKFPNDPTLKAQLFCMSKKLGFQNDAGELQMDKIASQISKYVDDPSLADKLIKCGDQKETPEDTAYEVAQCAYKVKFGMA